MIHPVEQRRPVIAGIVKPLVAGLLVLATLPDIDAARAQSAGAESPDSPARNVADLRTEQINSLISRIENPESREELITLLKILGSAGENPGQAEGATERTHIIGILSERIDNLGKELTAGMALVLDLSRLPSWLSDSIGSPEARRVLFTSAWQLALVFFVSFLLEFISRRLLARPRTDIENQEPSSLWSRFPLLAARTILDFLPLAVFATTAYLMVLVIDPATAVRQIAFSLFGAVIIARVILSLARMGLAPGAGNLRAPRISDENANYLMLWVRRFTNIGCYGFFLAEAALVLGLPVSGHLALTRAVGFLLMLLMIVFILQNRQIVDGWIRGSETGAGVLRRSFGSSWHVFAIIYVAVVYIAWALGFEGVFILRNSVLTAVIIAVAWLLVIGFRHVLNRALGLRPNLLAEFPGLAVRANRYLVILHVAASAFIWLLALLAVLELWGMDAFSWMASGLGNRIIGSILSSTLVIVMAVIFWEVTSSIIERHLNAETRGVRSVGARTRTLLPLAHTALAIIVATVASFTILSQIGIDIGPLLAGAGVLGLAVGFGSQTLVKDIVTGAFILAEDQFSVGDVISVGGTTGTVERVTIRTIRVRDLAGNVHIIPFSVVTEVENLTLEFSRYVFDIGVGYGEDVDHVIDVLDELGEKMYQDPVWGEHIRAPLEIMGLQELADSAVVIRARFETAPGYQWQIGREFNRRIKKRFDELGIEIPFPHRTVYFGEADGDPGQFTAQRRDMTGRRPPGIIPRDDGDPD